jgi:hypothetical protein
VIVSPNNTSVPAVWISIPYSEIRISTSGQGGFLKKRPETITVSTDSWTLSLQNVSQLFSSAGAKSGQENELIGYLV